MSDPFKIDSPTCISFSGGRTSAYMAQFVAQQRDMFDPNEEAIACFCGD